MNDDRVISLIEKMHVTEPKLPYPANRLLLKETSDRIISPLDRAQLATTKLPYPAERLCANNKADNATPAPLAYPAHRLRQPGTLLQEDTILHDVYSVTSVTIENGARPENIQILHNQFPGDYILSINCAQLFPIAAAVTKSKNGILHFPISNASNNTFHVNDKLAIGTLKSLPDLPQVNLATIQGTTETKLTPCPPSKHLTLLNGMKLNNLPIEQEQAI